MQPCVPLSLLLRGRPAQQCGSTLSSAGEQVAAPRRPPRWRRRGGGELYSLLQPLQSAARSSTYPQLSITRPMWPFSSKAELPPEQTARITRCGLRSPPNRDAALTCR